MHIDKGKKNNKLRVCYFGTYRSDFPRNQILIEGLRLVGVEVFECHETLWRGIEDRVHLASGGWLSFSFAYRILRTYWKLLVKFMTIGDYDIMVVGYPGQLDIFLAWLLTKIRRKVLVWDVLMSIYLVALERGLDMRSRSTIKMIRLFERWGSRLPDRLLLESKQYVDWFCQTHGIAPSQFCLIPLGADHRKYQPRHKSIDDSKIRIVYYGSFIPNHGVSIIIDAAELLQKHDQYEFILIGTGPEKEALEASAIDRGLTHVRFTGWVDDECLLNTVATADLCLGVFGSTPQSSMTIQNKIYECLAMRKALITGNSAVVQEQFTHGKDLFLCERNATALSSAILTLSQDPQLRESLALNGYRSFMKGFTIEQIGRRFSQLLSELGDRV